MQEIITYLTIGSAIIGAFWGLFQYAKGQKIKSAELLLNMETEFRTILPTIELIENENTCTARINPLLRKVNSGKNLTAGDVELLTELDRAFRFFFLCIVLEKNLAVTTKALRYAYYHYMMILAEPPSHASEVSEYLKNNYRRLSKWLAENKTSLQMLRKTGKWKSKRRIAWDGFWQDATRNYPKENRKIRDK